MNRPVTKRLFLALASGLLLGIPWAVPSLFFFIFFAWLPMIKLAEELQSDQNPYALFNYALLAFLLWNVLGSWWIMRVQWLGGACIILANALVQAFVFWLAGRAGNVLRLPFFVPFLFIWLGYEFVHNIWDLAWPWFNLGNAFITATGWIQWYAFTGVRGGSLWILLVNFALFSALKIYREKGVGRAMPIGVGILALVLMPILLSLHMYRDLSFEGERVQVALIQPNLDPYTEKFVKKDQALHMAEFLKTAEELCDEKTRYLFGPETLVMEPIDEENPYASPYFRKLLTLQKKYPRLSVIVGVESYRGLAGDVPAGSRFNREEGVHYEAFNSALFLPPNDKPQFYHKTKLVPLFERVPFVQYLTFLGGFSLELGGYNGTYSNRQERTLFESPDGSAILLPVVCFESVFGPYCAENLTAKKGFICVLTNDGWWKNTPGWDRHFDFSPVRAIECRRDLVRVANNGISALINAGGRVISRTDWWRKTTLKGEVLLRGGETYFVRHGDYLGRFALILGMFLLLWSIYARFRQRRFRANPTQAHNIPPKSPIDKRNRKE